MRQCIFVLGTRTQLLETAPVIQLAQTAGLRHTIWFTGRLSEAAEDVISELGLSSKFAQTGRRRGRPGVFDTLVGFPRALYGCYEYTKGVKLWTGKRPLVVVRGYTLSTWLGAAAGRWGGGDVVHLDSGLGPDKRKDSLPQAMLRRRIHRKARYAVCPTDEAAARMQRYPGCIVVTARGQGDDDATPAQMTVDALLRWSGKIPSD